ncbi:hypothetical protein GCM10011386_19940 [Parapedobacter defluvii]|uniref:Outer membrane protein beta-barrel domain-containing protein n=1 Tax=Parapedobacter defluvii TaxID=2045106 RepID=A0ABQ1LRJ0_9SPHI|nr:hypothetical protein [Parapedobacter defluvii]GGC27916.1 hypothetical protein GCM10011386_19940 [Parapedobacter defluvii]
MKIKLTLLTFFAAFALTASAQSDYKNSIGIRFGGGYYDLIGVAFKTFMSEQGALEFDLGVKPTVSYGGFSDGVTNLSLSGAYQHHFPIGTIEGFKWFVGGGAIIANTFSDYDDWSGISVGIFPTGGVDYKLKNAPFAFSADIRPTAHFVKSYGGIGGFLFNGGLTARYVF